MDIVSVIIPTYKGAEHIMAAVNSALTQSYPNVEIIVVDDNGLGTTEQLLTERALSELISVGKIVYIVHEVNKNGSAARNTGARASKGVYLNFLDDDDTICSDKLAIQVNTLSIQPLNCAFCYSSRITKIDGREVKRTIARKSDNLLYDYMSHSLTFGTGALLIRKKAWDEIDGYDESFRRHQDWEFVARLLDKFTAEPTPDAFFVRNYTMRNSPSDPKIREQYALQYSEKMMKCIRSLTPEQLRLVINNNMIGVAKKYLKAKQLSDFIRIYKQYGNGIRGIFDLVKEMFSWVVKKADNRNYE